MSQLAIKGHATRGKEVIEILEMFGVENEYKLSGNNEECVYYEKNGRICNTVQVGFNNIKLFTLDEFFEKFPYKIGDKVASMEGYHGKITKMQWDGCNNNVRYTFKDDECGTNRRGYSALMLYSYIDYKQVSDIFDNDNTMSSSFKTLLEEHKLEGQIIFGEGVPHKIELVLGDDFEVKLENGKTFVVRKTPQYPKTFDECLKILGYNIAHTIPMNHGHNGLLMMKLQQLLICRDAYWKLAGDWKPDWIQATYTCTIICRSNNIVKDSGFDAENKILAFPTEEMRDAFYENFKELIKYCKEIL